MKTSVIRYRVADFLREHAPFQYFSMEDLLALAGSGRVAFHEDLVFLFEKGQPRTGTAWVIQQGRIEIWNREADDDRMIDLLGPGDILGLRGQADEDAWPISARTATEVILYGFDLDALERYSQKHPEAIAFLEAATAATTPVGKSIVRKPILSSERERSSWLNSTAAVYGTNEGAGQTVAGSAAALATDMKCAAVKSDGTVPEYFLELMRSRAQSLLVTSDGTTSGKILDLITEEDLAAESGRNPALLLRKAIGATTEAQLARIHGLMEKFIEQELAGPSVVPWFAEVVSLWNDALIGAATMIAASRLAAVPADFSLLVFGSTARRERLEVRVDEIGIVYGKSGGETKQRFLEDGLRETLFRIFDFEPQIRGMSLDEWRDFYAARVRDPIANEYYLTREMLDFRCVYGSGEAAEELRKVLDHEIGENESFIRLLAHDTIASQPPLTWLRDSIVQTDGSESGKLDIEKTVLTPLADSARVIAIANRGFAGSGTIQRLAEASTRFPQYDSILKDAAAGWRIAAYIRSIMRRDQLKGQSTLSRLDQRLLKMSFDSTRQFLELTTFLYRTAEAQI